MAEGNGGNNKSLESFVLGIALAILVFLFLRKELERLSRNGGFDSLGGGGSSRGGDGGCGCGHTDELPENPGISLGLNSLNDEFAFPQSTVHSHGGGWITTGVSAGSNRGASFGG